MLQTATQTCRRRLGASISISRHLSSYFRPATVQSSQASRVTPFQRYPRWRNIPSHPSALRLSGQMAHRIHSSSVVQHGHVTRPEPGTGIKIHFEDSKGTPIRTVEANVGDDLLSIAHEYDIDLEGACEGSVACSTCHVILTPEYYDRLPEPDDEENDMLDMAFGLTDTSRLGCQVVVTKELDGMKVALPSATRNMFVDGKKSTH